MRITRKSTDYQVYKILLKEKLSGEEIGRRLGITRSAVWKAVERLRSYGIKINSTGRKYTISAKPDFNPYEIAEISFKMAGEYIDEVIYFENTDSTNERAKEEGRARILVFAESQTAGRGRLGRRWVSERGGLYFTITLAPGIDYTDLPKITLTAALSVAEALPDGKIKWPNDVLIRGKKVCGILSEIYGEMENPLIILGVGINVSNPIPDELKDTASSINEFYNLTRREVFESFMANFGKYYSILLEGGWSEIRKKFLSKCETIGKVVKVVMPNEEITGVAENLSEDGALVVNGRKVFAGDCIHLRNFEIQ